MSWHYSRALVAAYSAANSLDGARFAPLNGNPTPQLYLSQDRMTDFFRLSRSGMTCAPLTDDLGAELLTWYREASHARTSAQPEKGLASPANGLDCGQSLPGSFAKYDPNTRSWRTHQCLFLVGWEPYSETWPRWGTMLNGECSVQSMPVHLTSATESGLSELWPTPCLPGNGCSNGKAKMKAMLLPTPLVSLGTNGGPNQRDSSGRPGLQMAAMMWPTPCATEARQGLQIRRDGKKGTQESLSTAVRTWPTPNHRDFATPQARDFRTGQQSRWENPDRTRNLNDKIGGQLNPTWVEWLMGWIPDWTALAPIAADAMETWERGNLWETEPDIPRVSKGVPNRVDRLKAIGNGQVPQVSAIAWRILTARIEKRGTRVI